MQSFSINQHLPFTHRCYSAASYQTFVFDFLLLCACIFSIKLSQKLQFFVLFGLLVTILSVNEPQSFSSDRKSVVGHSSNTEFLSLSLMKLTCIKSLVGNALSEIL